MEVLIVDDDPAGCRLLEEIVERIDGAQPRTYLSPLHALVYAKATRPPLILLDHFMPEMDGLAFLRAMRALPEPERTAIVMITISSDRVLRRHALDDGAADFISKPIDALEVRARVRNLLELARRRAEADRVAHDLAEREVLLTAAVHAATAQVRERELETILRLTRAAEIRDRATGLHIARMARYCAAIGRAYGLDDGSVELLERAAPMHDIGKVATPDAVLGKPGPLTPAEWVTMREHARAGYDLLRDSDSPLLRCGAEIALTHHERYDGSGYPRGLAGEAIPLTGRIVAVADVFDALTSVRPYKPAWPLAEAVEEIHRLSGTQFDPRVVAAFDAALGEIIAVRETLRDAA